MEIKIVCENEKYLPKYANETDACMDLKVKIENEANCYFLRPQETVIFGTGIKASIPENHVMLVFPRSSTGIKLNCMLSNTTGVIDAGYRDEIRMALTNFGKETICLQDAQRVAQFMIIPRPKLELITVADDEEFRNGDRGGGIGSTGKMDEVEFFTGSYIDKEQEYKQCLIKVKTKAENLYYHSIKDPVKRAEAIRWIIDSINKVINNG